MSFLNNVFNRLSSNQNYHSVPAGGKANNFNSTLAPVPTSTASQEDAPLSLCTPEPPLHTRKPYTRAPSGLTRPRPKTARALKAARSAFASTSTSGSASTSRVVSREPVSVRIPWSTAITGARINLEDFEEDPAPEQAAEEAPLVIRAPTPVPAVPVPVTATEDVITASTPETPLSDVDVAIMAIMEEATVPPPKRKADSASDSTSESESDSDSESDGGSSVATEDTQYEHENDRATYDQSDSDSDSFGPRRQRRATSFATAQTRRHCIRRLVPAPVTCASVLPTTAHPHEDLCLFVSGPAQRLPGYLARPAEVPPLTHVQLEDDRIPADYVRYHLDPHLEKLYRVATRYRPLNYVQSPAGQVISPKHGTTSSGNVTMAFGVPELVAGRDADGTLAASVKGYQPDILVAVCKGPYNMDPRFPYSARPAPANAPASKFQLFPATHVAYSARCSAFPAPRGLAVHMRFVHPAHAYDSEAEDEEYERWERAQKKLRGENVSGSDDDAAKATTKGKAKGARPSSLLSLEPYLSIDAEAAYTSDASSTSAASNMASLDTGAHIHLPVVAIGVPFPEVFSVVHEQLFYPRRTWDATLLGLSSDVVTPQHAAEALARTSTSELGHKLWFIYRVWVNMLAIGIDDPTMWAAVDRTYSMIVKVVMDYRNHVRGRAEWAGRQLAQLKF